jgi:superfamily II DNA or RNA helicase
MDPETKRYEKSEHLVAEFRTSPQLRIAVTVDMIATGTDIKPLECLLFLRDVRSRVYFEQMKGRGTRVLSPTELQAVSGADARAKPISSSSMPSAFAKAIRPTLARLRKSRPWLSNHCCSASLSVNATKICLPPSPDGSPGWSASWMSQESGKSGK